MFQVADWTQRKREIADAFKMAAPLPAEADEEIYESVLARTGVANDQDMRVLISFIQDLIMATRREERPTSPMDTFLDWLRYRQMREE